MANLLFKFGTMNCGKSAFLIMEAHSHLSNGVSLLCIKPSIDNRYTTEMIKSRIGLEFQCTSINNNDNIFNIICDVNENLVNVGEKPLEYIYCDEAQFLTVEQVEQLARLVDDLNINVVCYGLKNDFQGHLFEASKRLIELSDEMEEIKHYCQCGKNAIINARIDEYGEIIRDGEIIEIGGNERYKPLCRKCYSEYIKTDLY